MAFKFVSLIGSGIAMPLCHASLIFQGRAARLFWSLYRVQKYTVHRTILFNAILYGKVCKKFIKSNIGFMSTIALCPEICMLQDFR